MSLKISNLHISVRSCVQGDNVPFTVGSNSLRSASSSLIGPSLVSSGDCLTHAVAELPVSRLVKKI